VLAAIVAAAGLTALKFKIEVQYRLENVL